MEEKKKKVHIKNLKEYENVLRKIKEIKNTMPYEERIIDDGYNFLCGYAERIATDIKASEYKDWSIEDLEPYTMDQKLREEAGINDI